MMCCQDFDLSVIGRSPREVGGCGERQVCDGPSPMVVASLPPDEKGLGDSELPMRKSCHSDVVEMSKL